MLGKGHNLNLRKDLHLNNKSKKRSKFIHLKKAKFIRCNLCGKQFKARSNYERFCPECKTENEEYQNHEDYFWQY